MKGAILLSLFALLAKFSVVSPLTGRVEFQGRGEPGPLWREGVRVSVCAPGYWEEFTTQTDTHGRYHVWLQNPPRELTVCINGVHSLGACVGGVQRVRQTFVVPKLTLLEGDANGDNRVDEADLAILQAAYDTSRGDPRFDEFCDFNLDGKVDVVDLAILSANMGREGGSCGER